ncbi:MAG: hypothetical protein ABGF52_01970 [Candidatus Asgardarchaeum sp.]
MNKYKSVIIGTIIVLTLLTIYAPITLVTGSDEADLASPWVYNDGGTHYAAVRVGGHSVNYWGIWLYDNVWISFKTKSLSWGIYVVETYAKLEGLKYRGRYPPIWITIWENSYNGEKDFTISRPVLYILKLHGICTGIFDDWSPWTGPWSRTAVVYLDAEP